MSKKNEIIQAKPLYPVVPAQQALVTYTDITKMERSSLRRELAVPRRKGWMIVVSFFAILFGWGGTAPIAGGAMAPGTVMPDKGRQKVQHYEGGIIQSILISEGDEVEANQPLIALTDISTRAGHDELLARSHFLNARLIRLEAEQQSRKKLTFPKALRTTKKKEAAAVLKAQKRLFYIRQNTFKFKHQISKERLNQLRKTIKGLKARLKSTNSQYVLNRKKLKITRRLYRKRLTTQDKLFSLENRKAELFGQIGQFDAEISKTKQQVAQVNIELSVQKAEHFTSISLELEKVRGSLSSVKQKLKSSADVLKRTIIRAPVAGRIVDLKPTTMGGVIRRGQTLMTIAPTHDKLIINARISPSDIDIVHTGLSAKVMFSAYSMREAPTIIAKIRSISADSFTEKDGQQPYYLARVEIDPVELAENAPNVKLVPGMQAQVLIVTKERTMLEYLIEPIAVSLRKSMRES